MPGTRRHRRARGARGRWPWSRSSPSSGARPSRCCRRSCSATGSFRVTSAIGFVIGFALFGALTYLPAVPAGGARPQPDRVGAAADPADGRPARGLDRVRARSSPAPGATRSSRSSARRSRRIGLLLLSRLDRDTGTLEAAALHARARGRAGVRACRCSCSRCRTPCPTRSSASPTSSATLFRSIGGSLGTAILGRDLRQPARRRAGLATAGGAAAGGRSTSGRGEPGAGRSRCRRTLHDAYVRSFTDSLSTVFVIAAAVVAVRFVLAWMLEERPLRRTIEDRDVGEALRRRRRTPTRCARSRASSAAASGASAPAASSSG